MYETITFLHVKNERSMKKIFLLSSGILGIGAFILISYTRQISDKTNDLLTNNIEALADNEHGFGWLWEKYWTKCTIASQIIVSQGSGSISVGTYIYSTSLLASLSQSSAVYTVVQGGEGQKSYCYDGWSFCSSDECR